MRILIITRSFAPDSGIATIRPTKMAKYLSKLGHDITVIRSGKINGKGDLRNLNGLENVSKYSYEGKDSDAERLERQEMISTECPNSTRQIKRKRNLIYDIAKEVFCFFYVPIMYYKNEGMDIKLKILDLYEKNMELRNFDVVISTFNPLGTIQAGRIISKKENCKWIIDFRDLMDNMTLSPLLRFLNARLQDAYCRSADACLCVSEGNSEALRARSMKHNKQQVYTIYNGYDESDFDCSIDSIRNIEDGKIHICYTGTMHGGQRDCSPLFRAIDECNLREKVLVDYAGKDGYEMIRQAKAFGLENIVINHGYLSRMETGILQRQSDLFLVISWNTETDKGILTGKFYEAIMHKKPIIALISGNEPNSELQELVKRYNLGISYEQAADLITYPLLKEYLIMQSNNKINDKRMEYNPSSEVYNKFEYKKIVKELDSILFNLVEEKDVCGNKELSQS